MSHCTVPSTKLRGVGAVVPTQQETVAEVRPAYTLFFTRAFVVGDYTYYIQYGFPDTVAHAYPLLEPATPPAHPPSIQARRVYDEIETYLAKDEALSGMGGSARLHPKQKPKPKKPTH